MINASHTNRHGTQRYTSFSVGRDSINCSRSVMKSIARILAHFYAHLAKVVADQSITNTPANNVTMKLIFREFVFQLSIEKYQ